MAGYNMYEHPACWDVQTDPLFRFTVKDVTRAWPYRDLMEAMYSADSKIVVLQFVLGTVIVGGPKTGEFYEGICSNKVTNLRVDGVEIVLVDLQLRDTEEAPQ